MLRQVLQTQFKNHYIYNRELLCAEQEKKETASQEYNSKAEGKHFTTGRTRDVV